MGAHLEAARLEEGADLSWAHLDYAHLEDAKLVGANLEHATLARAHLERSNLVSTRLQGARLDCAFLQGADLLDAHLEDAVLVGADLTDVRDINSAHLEGAIANDQTQWPSGFGSEEAQVRGVILSSEWSPPEDLIGHLADDLRSGQRSQPSD